ncbi:esterase/lipase family protein [Psychromicrobium lacuslunae]|uniref:esterase/lipase family protein n=1 Tax=Psychromicrobium lacuslunae TaxID=1618207 RepID=UPI0005D2D3CF|nr:alpha/beta fold hydrolase [Psychromicrobium lacuslunae]
MKSPKRGEAASWKLRHWSADYLRASWWQLSSVFSRLSPAAFAQAEETRPLIVLLPGVYETWHFMAPLAKTLHAQGYRVLPVPALGHNRRPVLATAQLVEQLLREFGIRAEAQGRRERVLLVAHSKGGLVGKQLMINNLTASAPEPKILGMVAIATPFGGSRLAHRLLGKTLNEFAASHQTITGLQASSEVNARIISILPRFDPLIPDNPGLEGAQETVLRGSGHFNVLVDQEAIQAVQAGLDFLQEPGE